MRAKDLRGRLSYLADSVRTAASNITNSRMRSVLTIVIVTLGITCLVGAQTAIDCLSSLLAGVFGTNSERISITAAKSRGGAGARKAPAISYQQAQRFLAEFEAAQLAGGDCLKTVYTYAPAVDVHNASGRLGPQTTVIAFEGDYFACNGITVSQGRPFGALDAGSNVCIVGKKVAAQAALGSQLYIGGKAYQVVGELQEQLSLLGMLTDNSVFVPIGAAMGSLIGETSNYSIDLSVAGEASAAAALARDTMRRVRGLAPGSDDDFEIIEGSAAERELSRLSGSLSGIALIIGLLTLLGAAVALANIMLICVAERTREVGIRRAVGATRRDIRISFIAEALLICEAGCAAGTMLGIICGNILSLLTHTPVAIPWDWILLAQAISLATGIAACALPARRAAAMDVVEALRCE